MVWLAPEYSDDAPLKIRGEMGLVVWAVVAHAVHAFWPRTRLVRCDACRGKQGVSEARTLRFESDTRSDRVQRSLSPDGPKRLATHGHTQRPADHRLTIDGREPHRHPLMQWMDYGAGG